MSVNFLCANILGHLQWQLECYVLLKFQEGPALVSMYNRKVRHSINKVQSKQRTVKSLLAITSV